MASRRADTLPLLHDAWVETSKQTTPSLVQAAVRTLRAGSQPLRAAFLARALNALARLTAALDETALGQAAGAHSDYEVLLDVLAEPVALAVLRDDDPLAAARLRGLRARLRLLEAEGGTLTVEQVAQHLHLTRQGVNKRRTTGRLLALNVGRRGYAYPAWQFTPQGLLPGLEDVLADLRAQDPWVQAAFFLNGNSYLDGATPLAELQHGNVGAVRRAAQAFGEHGAA